MVSVLERKKSSRVTAREHGQSTPTVEPNWCHLQETHFWTTWRDRQPRTLILPISLGNARTDLTLGDCIQTHREEDS